MGTVATFLKESTIFAASATFANDLSKSNKGGKSFYSIPEEQKFEKSLSSFLELDSVRGVHKC